MGAVANRETGVEFEKTYSDSEIDQINSRIVSNL